MSSTVPRSAPDPDPHVLGLMDPDPLVIAMDRDPDLAQSLDPSIIKQKLSEKP